MRLDLHVHTTASDGLLTPAQVIDAARAAGLDGVAITDHDSVAGVEEALSAAAGSPRVVPGVELSAVTRSGADVHILGLFIDHTDPAIIDTLATLRTSRLRRAERMVAVLAEAGFAVGLADVLAQAGEGAVGRSHVARALAAAGEVASVEEAFATLIGRGGPFFVPKRVLDSAAAIAAIRAAGGVAVLAHPAVTDSAHEVDGLVEEGLAGLEAHHAEHGPRDVARMLSLAQRYGLVVTGGSDHHGPGTRSAALGSAHCPPDALDALLARATISAP